MSILFDFKKFNLLGNKSSSTPTSSTPLPSSANTIHDNNSKSAQPQPQPQQQSQLILQAPQAKDIKFFNEPSLIMPLPKSNGAGSHHLLDSSIILSPVTAGVHTKSIIKRNKVKKKVTFPDDDKIIKDYSMPPKHGWIPGSYSTSDLLEAYLKSCERHKCKPLNKLIPHLKALQDLDCTNGEKVNVLNLKNERLDSRQMESLEEILKRLSFKTIDLESTVFEDEITAETLFDILDYYDTCEKLILASNKSINNYGWQTLGKYIRKSKSLEYIDLKGHTFQEFICFTYIARSMRLTTCLRIVHLENSNIHGRLLLMLAAALKDNEQIKEIYLSDNKIQASDGHSLANIFKENKCLELIDLRNNSLYDSGLSHICSGLSEQGNASHGLKHLIISNNGITANGISYLSKALIHNRSITMLNLSNNVLTNQAIFELKDSLIVNKQISCLILVKTKITDEGVIALAEYLAETKCLRRLDLRENDIRLGGIMALASSIKFNQMLTRLDLDQREPRRDYSIKDSFETSKRLIQDINEFCSKNKRLQNEREAEQREQARLQEQKMHQNAMESTLKSAKTANAENNLIVSNKASNQGNDKENKNDDYKSDDDDDDDVFDDDDESKGYENVDRNSIFASTNDEVDNEIEHIEHENVKQEENKDDDDDDYDKDDEDELLRKILDRKHQTIDVVDDLASPINDEMLSNYFSMVTDDVDNSLNIISKRSCTPTTTSSKSDSTFSNSVSQANSGSISNHDEISDQQLDEKKNDIEVKAKEEESNEKTIANLLADIIESISMNLENESNSTKSTTVEENETNELDETKESFDGSKDVESKTSARDDDSDIEVLPLNDSFRQINQPAILKSDAELKANSNYNDSLDDLIVEQDNSASNLNNDLIHSEHMNGQEVETNSNDHILQGKSKQAQTSVGDCSYDKIDQSSLSSNRNESLEKTSDDSKIDESIELMADQTETHDSKSISNDLIENLKNSQEKTAILNDLSNRVEPRGELSHYASQQTQQTNSNTIVDSQFSIDSDIEKADIENESTDLDNSWLNHTDSNKQNDSHEQSSSSKSNNDDFTQISSNEHSIQPNENEKEKENSCADDEVVVEKSEPNSSEVGDESQGAVESVLRSDANDKPPFFTSKLTNSQLSEELSNEIGL